MACPGDRDGDGTADCRDECPDDPEKSRSIGVCGCGVADTDTDGDGRNDCIDQCPQDPDPVVEGGLIHCLEPAPILLARIELQDGRASARLLGDQIFVGGAEGEDGFWLIALDGSRRFVPHSGRLVGISSDWAIINKRYALEFRHLTEPARSFTEHFWEGIAYESTAMSPGRVAVTVGNRGHFERFGFPLGERTKVLVWTLRDGRWSREGQLSGQRPFGFALSIGPDAVAASFNFPYGHAKIFEHGLEGWRVVAALFSPDAEQVLALGSGLIGVGVWGALYHRALDGEWVSILERLPYARQPYPTGMRVSGDRVLIASRSAYTVYHVDSGGELTPQALLSGRGQIKGDRLLVVEDGVAYVYQLPSAPPGESAFDACPDDPFKRWPERNGCGQPEADADRDGLVDTIDPVVWQDVLVLDTEAAPWLLSVGVFAEGLLHVERGGRFTAIPVDFDGLTPIGADLGYRQAEWGVELYQLTAQGAVSLGSLPFAGGEFTQLSLDTILEQTPTGLTLWSLGDDGSWRRDRLDLPEDTDGARIEVGNEHLYLVFEGHVSVYSVEGLRVTRLQEIPFDTRSPLIARDGSVLIGRLNPDRTVAWLPRLDGRLVEAGSRRWSASSRAIAGPGLVAFADDADPRFTLARYTADGWRGVERLPAHGPVWAGQVCLFTDIDPARPTFYRRNGAEGQLFEWADYLGFRCGRRTVLWAGRFDSDLDGVEDHSDPCPDRVDDQCGACPGRVGCECADGGLDSDADGVPDCVDGCPDDPTMARRVLGECPSVEEPAASDAGPDAGPDLGPDPAIVDAGSAASADVGFMADASVPVEEGRETLRRGEGCSSGVGGRTDPAAYFVLLFGVLGALVGGRRRSTRSERRRGCR